MVNQGILVVTRPFLNDVVTRFTYQLGGMLIDYAKSKGWNTIDSGSIIDRSELDSLLLQYDPILYIHLGHGVDYGFVGSDGKCLVCVNNNSILLDRVIHTISCLTAVSLGPSVLAAGAKAFIGYNQDLVYVISGNYVIDGFAETSLAFIYGVLDGLSLKEAYDMSVVTYDAWIDYYFNLGDFLSASTLVHDRDSLVVLGDDSVILASASNSIPVTSGLNIVPLIGLGLLLSIVAK